MLCFVYLADSRLDSHFLKISDTSAAKTLGLSWNASIDTFASSQLQHPISIVTKFSVLSRIPKAI